MPTFRYSIGFGCAIGSLAALHPLIVSARYPQTVAALADQSPGPFGRVESPPSISLNTASNAGHTAITVQNMIEGPGYQADLPDRAASRILRLTTSS